MPDRREVGDHCARVSRQDRGPEQDRGGHDQPEAEASHGVPGGGLHHILIDWLSDWLMYVLID